MYQAGIEATRRAIQRTEELVANERALVARDPSGFAAVTLHTYESILARHRLKLDALLRAEELELPLPDSGPPRGPALSLTRSTSIWRVSRSRNRSS
jgi:hypothetical protein